MLAKYKKQVANGMLISDSDDLTTLVERSPKLSQHRDESKKKNKNYTVNLMDLSSGDSMELFAVIFSVF